MVRVRIKKAISSGQITKDDALLIRAYIKAYRAEKHIKIHRVLKTTFDLVNWRRFIKKPYRRCKIEDIHDGITSMMNGHSLRGKPFAQNTKHDYVKGLRQFLFWLIGKKHSNIDTNDVKRIKVPARNFETVRPDEVLSDGEIESLLKACRNNAAQGSLSLRIFNISIVGA
jgi:site-specific recombinase XerD